ncbi:MAG: DUF3732 domain-containing protein [Glaciecola sp.]|jgi:hypothetical protein
MQIKKISLYGNNGERRDVDFKPSQVNVITGASKKGKSSLIDIVEYCLGSSECSVAEGHIKQTVKWYSVTLIFSDTEMFIARKSPIQGEKSSSACHMLVAGNITTPRYSELEGSTNITSIVAFLTSKLGIPEQVTEVPDTQTRSSIKIGFKHSRYYLFQGQDEVAAKRILFHRQSEPHIPQAIKDTLPYFMGAAKDDRLSEIEKLRALKRDKVRLLKRIKEIVSLKGEGLQKGHDLLAEAQAVGLYESKVIPTDTQLLDVLRNISRWVPSNIEDNFLDGDPSYELDMQYREFSEQKKVIRSRLRAANEYAGSIDGFEGELSEQALRLKSIGIFKNISQENVCSVCERPHDEKSNADKIIEATIAQLDNKLEGVNRNKPRITNYLQDLRAEDKNLAESLKKTRSALEVIQAQEVASKTKAQLDAQRLRVIGRISLYLESVDLGENIQPIQNSIDELEPQIEELEEKLDPETLKERLESQLSLIGEDMTRWARELGLEHSENPIRLDITKLTVVAETPSGRTPLYRIGSGENWVGYHLVAYLALAKWFIEQNRPVGRFIFFDQPTQVYFPSDNSNTGNLNEIENDEDREAVKRMFEWIFKVVEELSPNLQVIITDHADIDEDWFQSSIADTKWRGENALIPKHWYEQSESNTPELGD